MLKIGKVIKAKRKECDLTQEELATLLGVTKAADQQIRNRKKSIPRELQGQISFFIVKEIAERLQNERGCTEKIGHKNHAFCPFDPVVTPRRSRDSAFDPEGRDRKDSRRRRSRSHTRRPAA